MKACYVDTSIIVGLLFQQPMYKEMKDRLHGMQLFSHQLLISELLAVGKRESIPLQLLIQQCKNINLVTEISELDKLCMHILSFGNCRGADLHHLACAYFLDPTAKELIFASADHKQAALAKQLGFTTIEA